ncbi:hypothetical protein PAPHI01_2693 [Pancytospora philotis]|nr:hypothetical protein PAPHI01_2693 [Pancytospora philotis]
MAIESITIGKILAFSEAGFGQAEIAEKLGISQSTVSRCLKRHALGGPTTYSKSSGRPTVVSAAIETAIMRQNKACPTFSLRKHVAKLANDHEITISYSTVRCVLNGNGVAAHSPAKKPALLARHIENRFAAARAWIGFTERELQSIVFSDESKFNLLQSDGKVSVWRGPCSRYDRKHIIETKKFGGGSVMVWACFSYGGVGKLVFIEGIMDAYKYVSILATALPPSLEQMGLTEFIFQQDNDAKHTAKVTKCFFENRSIRVMPWPAMSPDMNPIENLWEYVKRRVAELEPKNIADLKRMIMQAWSEIPLAVCQKYAMSFANHALALCRSRGEHTKY